MRMARWTAYARLLAALLAVAPAGAQPAAAGRFRGNTPDDRPWRERCRRASFGSTASGR